MPSGGHSRSGRPPDPNALRRERDGAEWMHLSLSDGGKAPSWPLSRASRREITLWTREWARPQARMWRSLGLELEVALYVRNVAAAEQPDASPPVRTLVLRQMDSLGLTTGGLARNRWIIDGAGAAPEQEEEPVREDRPSARERLKLVAG